MNAFPITDAEDLCTMSDPFELSTRNTKRLLVQSTFHQRHNLAGVAEEAHSNIHA